MAALNHAMRRIEDFIIDHTVPVPMDEQSILHTVNSPKQNYLTKPNWYQQAGPSKSTILVMETSPDPTSWHAYTSDEEVASPLHNDRSSVRSRNSSICSESSLPELLADTCTAIEQQCGRAHTVTIRSPGKPRMVSMPKPTDTSRRSISRPASAEQQKQQPLLYRRNASDSQSSPRTSHDSQSASSRSNSVSDLPASPTSTAPSSVYDEEQQLSPKLQPMHQRRISKHIDLMEAARAIHAPTSPYQPLTPVFTRPATFADEREEALTSSEKASASSVRKKSKFSSGFKGLGRNFNRKELLSLSTSTLSYEDDEVKHSNTLNSKTSRTFNTHSPHCARPKSAGPRMVPRPANERAPLVQLPPYVDK